MSTSLDQWTQKSITKKEPMIKSAAHEDDLYENSYSRMIEKRYEGQIAYFLEDEKAEKEAHKEYVDKNYIRVGGN